MKVTNEFTDDHLPCVEFEHNGVKFELCWTSNKVIGALELLENGDLDMVKFAKRFPQLYNAITNPQDVEDEDNNEDGKVTAYIDEGCLIFERN